MDEACASARVAQDMKPEAIDILEQDLLHEEAHIKALEVSSLSLARAASAAMAYAHVFHYHYYYYQSKARQPS
jgi:hypothetical protein